MALDLLQAHYDQAKQALDAGKNGQYSEAFGHTLAAITPMVGPMAAHLATRLSGSPPVFDKFGNVVTQGQHPDPTGAIGEAVPQLVAAALPAVVRGVSGAPAAAATEGAEAALEGAGAAPAASGGLIKSTGAAPAASGGLIKSTLNPTQQAAVDYLQGQLQAQGKSLDVGTLTGSKFVKGVQKLAGSSPLGAGVVGDASRSVEAGQQAVMSDLARGAAPVTTTPEEVGNWMGAGLRDNARVQNLIAGEGYGRAWQGMSDPAHAEQVPISTREQPVFDATGQPTGQTQKIPVMGTVQMPVAVDWLKDDVAPMLERMSMKAATDQANDAAVSTIKNILKWPDYVSAQQAEWALGGLKTAARPAAGSVLGKEGLDVGQGTAAYVVPKLQEAINSAVAKTGVDALQGLQQGRAATASKADIQELAAKLSAEPVQSFDHAIWKNDAGIAFIRKIDAQLPGWGAQTGRTWLEQAGDVAGREGGFSKAQTLFNRFADLGEETKKIIFPNPAVRENVGKFFLASKLAAENVQPSGTALVGQSVLAGDELMRSAVHLFTGEPLSAVNGVAAVGGYALAMRAIAKLLYSPRGARLLAGGLTPESGPAAAMRAAQILRLAGPDGVAPLPPGAAAAIGATGLNAGLAQNQADQQQ
jgi:hypothetical protein